MTSVFMNPARGVRVEGHEVADLGRVLALHLAQELLLVVLVQVHQEVGRVVRAHLLQDVRGIGRGQLAHERGPIVALHLGHDLGRILGRQGVDELHLLLQGEGLQVVRAVGGMDVLQVRDLEDSAAGCANGAGSGRGPRGPDREGRESRSWRFGGSPIPGPGQSP
jgi:hypothetical protein